MEKKSQPVSAMFPLDLGESLEDGQSSKRKHSFDTSHASRETWVQLLPQPSESGRRQSFDTSHDSKENCVQLLPHPSESGRRHSFDTSHDSRENCAQLLPQPSESETTMLRTDDSLGSQICRNFHVAFFLCIGMVVCWFWGLQAALLTYNVMLAMIFGQVAKLVHSCCCRRRSSEQDGYYVNSKKMSKPNAIGLDTVGIELPTATVYVAVYREPFEEVLRPTLLQALKVVQHYNRTARATKANLIVLDDGLLAVSKEEYAQRKEFYHACGIAYTARPRNGAHGYEREGFFKKSGNLNFVHRLDRLRRQKDIQGDLDMLRMHEEQMDSIDVDEALSNPHSIPVGSRCKCCDHHTPAPWSVCSELVEPIDETCREIDFPRSLALAEVHGNVALGDYLLLLDNDSWAPETSLVDTVEIMMKDDTIGFVQHSTGPLNLYENMVTEVYGAGVYVFWGVLMPVRAWACPPALLGHNVVLRRDAIEAAGLYHTGRGSDDVATNIHMRASSEFRGLFVQLYPWESGFLEGVEGSYIVIASQLRRYGAISHSLVFNPMPDWWKKGLLDEGFKKYIFAPHVTSKEIFDTFLFFFGGVQGTVMFCNILPRMVFAAWLYVLTGSPDALMNRSSGAMKGFLVSIGTHALIALLILVVVSRKQVRLRTVFKFILLGPPLYASLWWSFTVGFAFDHFFKYAANYSSTRKDKRLPTFLQLLRCHNLQIGVGLFAVAPFVVLLFLDGMPLSERVKIAIPMCMLSGSMLLSPFVYEKFTWTKTADAAATTRNDGLTFRERSQKGCRRVGMAISAILENLVKIFTMRAGDRGFAVVDGLRSWALLWMLSYHALAVWFSWEQHDSGWWEWLGTFDAAADKKPSAYLSLLQENATRLIRTGSLAADMFLVLSGFLVGRSFIKWRVENSPVRRYFSFVVHRWLRLVPVLIISFFVANLFPMREACSYASWNNFLGFNGCIGEQVLAEFQLYAITPLIMTLLLPMSDSAGRFLRPTLVTIGLCTTCIIIRGSLLWKFGEVRGGVRLLDEMHFFKSYLRASSYFCGLFVACLLHISDANAVLTPRPPLIKALSRWMSSMALLMMLIISYLGTADSQELAFDWNHDNPRLHCLAFVFSRPMFGVMFAYILWRTVSRQEESLLLVRFLSQRIWAPVAAVAYSSYAMHAVPLALAAQWGHIFINLRWSDDAIGSFAAYSVYYLAFAGISLLSGLLLHGFVELPFEELRRSVLPTRTVNLGGACEV